MNKTLIGIAVAVGMVIGLPLYLYVVNHLFYKGNDAKAVIPTYIQNSIELKVQIPEQNPFDLNKSLLTFEYSDYKSVLNKNGNGNLYLMKFYSSEYKKYFVARLFDYSKTFFLHLTMDKKDVFITVNQDDLNNTKYGSKTNPVPVFKYRGLTPLIHNDVNLDITEAEYQHNVTQYLTYYMSKEDFKKRFGK
ncbi:hypothetical protein [Mucilaginibacter polytrichastri]|uniref:DUF8188 domain-containing protein n=1 Tax=Mucilaginibacter polytrichastri TaxID=1302689 RepID=A0A1Q6A3Q9_9SPHI|nr:hypothetical protein [Mucilaginibacter polytrichastri]OKS88637.1 hypothetical protein RG47T_4109 [Mucilaginibacter polytrichastri]SFT26394.1 hypothetical protein SAMN04487890_12518 [Mucilaginibacter polytrichastri]